MKRRVTKLWEHPKIFVTSQLILDICVRGNHDTNNQGKLMCIVYL